MDFENITLNQLIDLISDNSVIRVVRYTDDKIEFEGIAEKVKIQYKRADFNVLSIEYHKNAIEITFDDNIY